MTKPLGYYVSSNPGGSKLLDEMQEAWGSTFEALNNCQRLWMIYFLAADAMNDGKVYEDHELDEQVTDFVERVGELELHQKVRLIEAIISQVQGI